MNTAKLRLLLSLLFFCVVISLSACVAADGFPVSSSPESFILEGTVTSDDPAGFTVETSGATETSWLKRGTVVTIVGGEGGKYKAVFDGQTGWIPKGGIRLDAVPAEGAEEDLNDTLSPDTLLPTKKDKGDFLVFSGELSSLEPLDSLTVFIWDERELSVEKIFFIQLKESAYTVDASALNWLIPVDRLRGGRKTLTIQGNASGRQIVLCRMALIVRGRQQEPAHITEQCTNIPYTLSDNNVESAWKPNKDMPSVTIGIPEGAGASLMTLEWQVPPASFTVTLADRNGQTLSETVYETGMYMDSVELNDQVASVTITPTGERCALATIRVYPAQYSDAVQRWQPLPDKVDLMVFSAHQDDELLFFGGTIPYYSAIGKTVAVTYMTNCGRSRYREALDGLWTTGLKYHPIFIGWRDIMISGMDVAMSVWKQSTPDPLLDLVRIIRKYRPDVIVTHDFKGEYGHMQHQLTAKLISEAAVLAGDASYDPETEPWEVSKVYIHLYEENQIVMDWSQPLYEDSPLTPLVLATEAFDKHASQRDSFSLEKHGVLYDNRCFGLFYSTVGEDQLKNDFFENIP